MDADQIVYRIHWIIRDEPSRYPFEVFVRRGGVIVGSEGACSEEECRDALWSAIRQARARMKNGRESR